MSDDLDAGRKIFRDDYVGTYFALRMWLGGLAVVLPVSIYLTGRAQGLALQPSMSAYYYTDARNFFVGLLCAVACGLVAYKGFSRLEDYALNFAGAFALGVAFFPTGHKEVAKCNVRATIESWPWSPPWLHIVCAVAFFGCLGVVVFGCAHRTLHVIHSPAVRLRYRVIYTLIGVLFVGSMVGVGALSALAESDDCGHWLFGVELAGVLSFAVFWFVKTHECHRYGTDARASTSRRAMEFKPEQVEYRHLLRQLRESKPKPPA